MKDDHCLVCGAHWEFICRLPGRCKALGWKLRKEREKHGVSEITERVPARSPVVQSPSLDGRSPSRSKGA